MWLYNRTLTRRRERFTFYLTGLLLLLGVFIVQSMAGLALARETYSYSPIRGTMTSAFGWRTDPFNGNKRFHSGVDIAADAGTPIRAPQAGQVVYSGRYGGYGNVVVIQHHPDLYTLYGHTAVTLVNAGDIIQPGQVIAKVGSTGRSTGPHLHFEVRRKEGFVNPLEYLAYLESGQSPYGTGEFQVAYQSPPAGTSYIESAPAPVPAYQATSSPYAASYAKPVYEQSVQVVRPVSRPASTTAAPVPVGGPSMATAYEARPYYQASPQKRSGHQIQLIQGNQSQTLNF